MMQSILISLVSILVTSCVVQGNGEQEQNDGFEGTMDVIRSRGFLCEHYVIKTHGYPLTLYRIINPLANPDTLNRYPVLYGHGVLFDSKSMISRSENARPRKPVLGQPTINYGSVDDSDDFSLPFMLSNNNFDVWLYDARGTNDFNRNATVTNAYSPQADKFWDYSLDDQTLRDLPLQIDFVLTKTASTQIVYVGFSESTFFLFGLLATVPEYSDRIVAILAMAPVAYVGHLKGVTVPLLAPIAVLTPETIHHNFVPQPIIDAVDVVLKNLCAHKSLSNLICAQLINAIGGKGVGHHTPTFYQQFFKSTSLKAIRHFLQLFIDRRFGMYDYGPIENLKRYGQIKPPNYDIGKIRSDRIILARGEADYLSTPEDQDRLISELKVKLYKDIVIPQFNHFDFIDGKDLIKQINGPAVTMFYEMMYKNGDDVLKTPEQILATPGGRTTTINFEPSVAALKAMSLLEPNSNKHGIDIFGGGPNPVEILTDSFKSFFG